MEIIRLEFEKDHIKKKYEERLKHSEVNLKVL